MFEFSIVPGGGFAFALIWGKIHSSALGSRGEPSLNNLVNHHNQLPVLVLN